METARTSSVLRRRRVIMGNSFLAADYAATFLFAVEGAIAAVRADADIFGMVVIAFVTALGGGVVRDLILGDRPPAAFRNVIYPALAMAGAVVVFVVYQFVTKVPDNALNTMDAAALALFCVSGTDKALAYRLNVPAAIILGITTGSGGGVVRDVLLNRQPAILHAHIYAVAAGAGAALLVLLDRFSVPRPLAMLAGFLACFVLRVLSFALDWNLPHVHR